MPLLLLLPLLVAGAFALWVVLMPLAIVQRYRLGRARRRVQPWFVHLNGWLLGLSALVFLATAAVLDRWLTGALADASTGLAIGVVVGGIGSRLDRFEATTEGLYRTPNRGLLLGLSLLLAARIVVGIALAWGEGAAGGPWQWMTRGWLRGVGGVLLGHALATAWTLRWRLPR